MSDVLYKKLWMVPSLSFSNKTMMVACLVVLLRVPEIKNKRIIMSINIIRDAVPLGCPRPTGAVSVCAHASPITTV